MASTVAVGKIAIYLPESQSLKDKRHVIRSILQRVRNQFNVSIAEIEDLDDLTVATIAIVAVSNSAGHANEQVQKVIDFVERNVEIGTLGEIETESIPI